MAVRIIQSLCIGQIVAAFYVDGVDKKNGYRAAVILTVCTFTEALVHHPLFLECLRTGMDFRVALSSVVYNKVQYLQRDVCDFWYTVHENYKGIKGK